MANQACISIGINQYQSLQPLGYGLADAVAMERFFVDAAGWDRSQCLLMTDTSTNVRDRATYPDRENINKWLNQWCWDTLKPGDLLIFFFSGYGVNTGDEDYLIPIDGNPADLAQTCISIRQIYQQLHDTGASVLVFLDANRSQNMSSGGGIGKVTEKLAQAYQIPTFLACQSHEFSHEAAGLGHGLFTAALLEALNYHPDLNIETLEAYLTSRLAELGEHHWKPIQTPVALVPSSVSVYRPIFSATTQSAVSTAPDLAYSPPTQPQLDLEDNFYYRPPTPLTASPAIAVPGAIIKVRAQAPESPGLSNWAKVSALIFMLIGAGGGIYAFQQAKLSTPHEELPIVSSGVDSSIVNAAQTAGQIPSLSQAKLFVKPGDATSRYQAILAAQKIPANDPAASEVKQSIEQWSQEIYEIAQGYAGKQYWKLAIDTARMVPPQATSYSKVQLTMSEWQGKIVK
jgi:Caspase domain